MSGQAGAEIISAPLHLRRGYGICFHRDCMVASNCPGADYRPFLDGENSAKGTQMVVRNNATDTVFCRMTNDK